MRTVHIRFTDYGSVMARTTLEYGVLRHIFKNLSGCTLVLMNPKLRRTILHGTCLHDEWGNTDKWFDDYRASLAPLWSLS